MTESAAIQQRDSGGEPTSADEANDTGSDHPKLPHQVAKHLEDHKADQLTFFGTAPLAKRLSGQAVDFLLNHRRWAKPEDPPEVVGKKNVIIMFTIHAEIEDCLVGIPFGNKVDRAKPLGLLQQLLDISYMKSPRGPRAYTFALAILKAYTNSRYEQISEHLVRNQWPPEPEAPMDKVLLSVVDRRLVFMFTRKPLHTMPVSSPHSRLQHHRLKLERFLSNEAEVEKAFMTFTPMVPEANQRGWPKPWHIESFLSEQERRCRKKFNLPQTTIAHSDTGPTTDTGPKSAEANGDYINAQESVKPSTRPSSSEVFGGLCIYTLAIRLACNYISTDPAPTAVQNFCDVMFRDITEFAKYLEQYLKDNQPDSAGQFQATDQNDIAAVTIVISPAEIRKLLEAGMAMVVWGFEVDRESLSLFQWSRIATEVQQGKVAIQNACEESLARRLPHEFRF
ncbi:hypothetical protein SLS64_013519 [Diaporthe eres]|uniref:Uncharacterized protein n=1 Tax=Diaporthe eres TaxID=83184 RepID=A0ABR1NS62_DIAER